MDKLPSKTYPLSSLDPTRSPLVLAGVVVATAVVGGLLMAYGGPLAGLAILLMGAAAFVVLRNIEIGFWGIIGVVCLLPFATVPVDIGLTPTFLDLALAAVVGIWALGLVTGKQRDVITAPITLPMFVFIMVAIFAFIFGLGNGPLTPTLLRKFAELILSLSFVFVVVDYCREWVQVERLVKVLLLAGAGASLLAIGLWALPDDLANDGLNMLTRVGYPGGWVIRYIEENSELGERAIGTSIDPNVLGGLLLMLGALAGPQLVIKRPLFARWQIAGIIGLIFLALVLTFSRGAMVGLAAGLGFVALARYRRLIPYMLVIGLMFLLLPISQEYIARFLEGIQGEDLATQMRFGEYKDALRLVQRYPVFGVGFAGTPDIDIYLGVANVYLTIAQTMGLVGLASFFTALATVFGYAFFQRHGFKEDDRQDAIWLGLHAALIGGLVAGFFDHYLFNLEFHHAVTIFWLLVGMATAVSHLAAKKRTKPANF